MPKRLYRSRAERMIGGVCGGLAEYFDVDPVLIRVIFVAITLGGGFGVIAYIILWIVVPQEDIVLSNAPGSESYSEKKSGDAAGVAEEENVSEGAEVREKVSEKRIRERNVILAAILIIIGGLWFLDNLIPPFDFDIYFPILLIVVGILIFIYSNKRSRE